MNFNQLPPTNARTSLSLKPLASNPAVITGHFSHLSNSGVDVP
jgi:hypothetical protein